MRYRIVDRSAPQPESQADFWLESFDGDIRLVCRPTGGGVGSQLVLLVVDPRQGTIGISTTSEERLHSVGVVAVPGKKLGHFVPKVTEW